MTPGVSHSLNIFLYVPQSLFHSTFGSIRKVLQYLRREGRVLSPPFLVRHIRPNLGYRSDSDPGGLGHESRGVGYKYQTLDDDSFRLLTGLPGLTMEEVESESKDLLETDSIRVI